MEDQKEKPLTEEERKLRKNWWRIKTNFSG